MKIKAANGIARILKTEGVPWVSCFPTNHVNNALGEENVPILMMGEERFAVAVADWRSTPPSGWPCADRHPQPGECRWAGTAAVWCLPTNHPARPDHPLG